MAFSAAPARGRVCNYNHKTETRDAIFLYQTNWPYVGNGFHTTGVATLPSSKSDVCVLLRYSERDRWKP